MTTRGRLAPTPTGLLHVGHARTFATAAQRAAGRLVLRLEDLDSARCQPEFAAAALEDLRWGRYAKAYWGGLLLGAVVPAVLNLLGAPALALPVACAGITIGAWAWLEAPQQIPNS